MAGHPTQLINQAEGERLEVVRRYDVLDTPPDGTFDRITALAARLLRVPIAIISIVDHDRIWFKSRHGLDAEQINRDPGLCASCILQDAPWVVTDARADARALANPLVAGAMGVQFYLGIPLRTHDNFNLGTLCVLDFKPRTPTEADVSCLQDLAAVVMDELEMRLAARRAAAAYHAELVRRELREDHIKGLMRELAHRAKNLLAVVQAVARHTAQEATDPQSYARTLTARIAALAYTHDLIADQQWRGAHLDDLVRRQVANFVDPDRGRFSASGPDLMITPATAQNLGLALHELATNAKQYGALSNLNGAVAVDWKPEGPVERGILLTWRESAGPPVEEPQHKKFGCLALERLVPQGVGGSAQLAFEPTGVTWSCEIPSDKIVDLDTSF